MPSTISAGTTAGTAIAITGDTTGNLAFQTNGTTTAMTINTSQQVGIGTTTPTSNVQLDVVSADASQQYVDVLKLKTTNTGDYHPAILFENNRGGISNAAKIITDSGGTAGSGFLGFRLKNSGGTFVQVGGFNNDGNFQFNSGYGSSAVAYGCRAWVNFNGTGTVAIRGSGNVTSITDNGTGDYTVNFTTALPDTNYAISASAARDIATDPLICGPRGNASTYSTSAVRIVTFSDGGTISDSPIVGISVFR